MATEQFVHTLAQKDFGHPTQNIQILETHLSWVILTGPFAYKIKKPLNLGFQDFTTLAKRKKYCELELKLNKRLAPTLYIDVIPLYGSNESPQFTPMGEPIEYAIKMHEFRQEDMLHNLSQQNKLDETLFDKLAKEIADFHQKIDVVPPNESFGTPEAAFQPVQGNFDALYKLQAATPYLSRIKSLEKQAKAHYHQLQPILTLRKNKGFIRECHGDLHLENIVLFEGKPTIFDCIEFNELFRKTDVISDVAFLAMDLIHHQKPILANYLINKYFEYTGDYEGIALLDFYIAYRAMVRAKVAVYRLEQLSQTPALIEERTKLQSELQTYITLAENIATPRKPKLTITYGVAGSGKTTFTESFMTKTGAIRLRSDVIRKQLFNLPLTTSNTQTKKIDLYAEKNIQKVYEVMCKLAHDILKNNYSVIIDATFLKTWQRDLFATLAKMLNVPFTILTFEAPKEALKKRISERQKEGLDASSATFSVAEEQLKTIEPLSEQEKSHALVPPID